MRNALRTTAIALAVSGLGGPLAAQSSAPGWIGISFEVTGNRWGRAERVVITDVNRGSPAQAAGIEVGDRLVSINELRRPDELNEITERLHLRAGDPVTLRVERDGRRIEVRLQAAERPREFARAERFEFSFRPDSMVETMFRAMDSLRISLVQGSGRTDVRVVGSQGAGESRVTVLTPEGARTVRAPFEFFVFRGDDHDSLSLEMVELNRVMAELQARIGERSQELSAAGRVTLRRASEDREVQRLEIQLEDANRRSTSLQAAMAEAARATAGLEYSIRAPSVGSGVTVSERPTEEFRPLAPYLLGRNRVAGAEVIDLRPELAEYFEVVGGVLVLDVARGTPAAIAGIIPGDVITRLDQVVVRSVEDLRFGISQAGETLPISLMRQGSSRQVLLRR